MARKKFITVMCYGKVEIYPESKREELQDYYLEGVMACDGAEKERYMNIYCDLKTGNQFCSDGDNCLRI